MSTEQLAALKAKFDSDPAFQAEIKAAKSREEAMRIAAAHGLKASFSSELTDTELDGVSGGCSSVSYEP